MSPAGKLGGKLRRAVRSAFIAAGGLAAMFAPLPGMAAGSRPNVTDLIEVADISDIAISPDKTVAAVKIEKPDVASNRVTLTWYVVPLQGTAPARILADGGEPIWDDAGLTDAEEPIWSADSKWLYFRARHGEEVQVWRASRWGNSVEAVTNDAADVEEFSLDTLGGRLFYTVKATRDEIKQAERDEYSNGVLLDPSVQVHTALLHNFPYHGRMTTIRHSPSAWTTLLGATPPRIRVLDIDARQPHDAGVPERLEFERMTNSAKSTSPRQPQDENTEEDGGKVAFFETRSSPADPIAEPPTRYRLSWHSVHAPATAIACSHPACTVKRSTRVRWSVDGREVFFVAESPDNTTTLYAWNIVHDSVRSVAAVAGLLGAGAGSARYRAVTCPVDREEAICTTAAADSPPRLEAVDLRSGRRRVLLDPNDELRREPLSRPEALTWRDRWGRAVTGVLLLPDDPALPNRLPLVITSYRCTGFLRGGTGADVPEQVLAQAGFAVLCINFDTDIGQLPYPSPEVPPGQASLLQTALDGWEAGVDLLHHRGLIDPERVGISGLSFGAEAVLYAASHSRRFTVAAASHPPYTDPVNYYNLAPAGEFGARLLTKLYGLPAPDKDPTGIWQRISPALNVQRITAPILIQTDEDEFRPGVQFYASMEAAHKPLEFFVFPDEAHQFVQPAHRAVRNGRYIDWFRFWLQGYEDNDPSKAGQYVRWRQWRGSAPGSARAP